MVFLLLSLAIYFFGRKLLTVDVVTAHGQLQPFPPLPPRWVLKLAERVVGFFDFLRIALLPAPLVATQMLTDFWKNQATYVVVRLGIPDMIPLALKHGTIWTICYDGAHNELQVSPGPQLTNWPEEEVLLMQMDCTRSCGY